MKLEPHFLALLICSEYGKRFFLRIAKRTTNLASINKTQLSSFSVLLPSLTEQEAIVSLISGVDRIIKANETEPRNLEKLKRGLVQDLLTCRVREGGISAPKAPLAKRYHANRKSVQRKTPPLAARNRLDSDPLSAYTFNMSQNLPAITAVPCLCNALRQASRTVTRLYDEELRQVGLRTTQYTLLSLLHRAGEVRQGDLSDRLLLEETTLTRNLRALVTGELVAIRAGTDRREKLVAITPKGLETLKVARPAWLRAQERMKALLSEGLWHNLLTVLPQVARLAANSLSADSDLRE